MLENYLSEEYAVSDVVTENLYSRMTNRIDNYLATLDFEKGEHVFFFPPYSSLYWCNAQNKGYFDEYLQAKEYFVQQVSKHGVMIYDFQCTEATMNLDNYKDTTHYTPEINDWMVECFSNGEYILTNENYDVFEDLLITNTNEFRDRYESVLK